MTSNWTGVLLAEQAKHFDASHCQGEHTYFCAESVANEGEGKVYLLGFCTHCSAPLQLKFEVGKGTITLLPK